jgi:hypothetical protein
MLRVPGQQQHAVVQQSHQQQWQQSQQLGAGHTLHTDIGQAWTGSHSIPSDYQVSDAASSSTLAHQAGAEPAGTAKQQRKRHRHTLAETYVQHSTQGHHQLQQQQQPGDMTSSDLAAAFLKLLKQQQAAASQQQAHHTSSSSSPSLQSNFSQPAAASYPCDAGYYQQLLQQTQLRLPQLQPRQASLILYAAAKLRRPPQQQLLAALLQQCLQQQQLQQLPPAGLTNVLWALAVVGYSPGQQWMAGFYAASCSSSSSNSSGMASFNRHQLCSMLWSLGSLQERPPAEWLQQLLAALRPHLPDLQPSELSNVLWGLAQLGYRPSKGWAKEWFSASSRVMNQQRGAATAATAAADVDNDSTVDHTQGSRMQHSSRQRLQQRQEKPQLQGVGFSSDHLACIAGSLGLLRLDPRSGHWLQSFRRCVLQQLPRMRGAHVATVLCGLAKRRSSQPPHWAWLLVARQVQLLEGQQQLVRRHRAGLPAAAAAAVCAGQAAAEEAARQDTTASVKQQQGLQQLPSAPTAAADQCAVIQQQLLQPADIAATVWALPWLLYPTAALWKANTAHTASLKALAAASLPLLPSCSSAQLVQLAVGFAGLRFYPGAHWLKVHENAVAARYSSMNPANQQRLRAAVRVMWSDG